MPRYRTTGPMVTLAAFAGGALAGFLASRVAPPVVAQAAGAALGAAGSDPFAALARDHQAFRFLLDDMADAADRSAFTRSQLLFRLKRRLAAHAMAEEDVVYPLLREREEESDQSAMQLYEDHAQIKILLHRLEQAVNEPEAWRSHALALKTLLDNHARAEEEVEFPRLRAALDGKGMTQLSAHVRREKALLL